MITIYRVALLVIILYFPIAGLLLGEPSINSQQEEMGPGEYYFQVSQEVWRTFKIAPCHNCEWKLEPSTPVRVRFDDGREFQKLPSSRDFRLPNGSVINTNVLEILGNKHIPVESWGTMPSPFFYLRAETGPTNIHLIIKQNMIIEQNDPSRQPGVRLGKGIIDLIGGIIAITHTSGLIAWCCCMALFIYMVIHIWKS